MTILIKVDTKQVEGFLNKMPNAVNKSMTKGIKMWGEKHLVRSLLISAKAAGINPFRRNRGLFTGGTRWEQKGNIGKLIMPKSGLVQDHAEEHWVSSTPNNIKPMLQAWMQQKWGKKYGKFYFRPKPFITEGYHNAMTRLPSIMQQHIEQALTESKVKI